MISNDAFLHKQGPLARVWIAAHWERKLSKSQFLQTPIPSNVDMIVEEDEGHVALRLSGQLLLGFARIYSRKAKYLQDDCSDALLRIKVAFRGTAVIDLSHEQLHVSRTALTLPDVYSPIDLLMPEPSLSDWGITTVPSAKSSLPSRHIARHSDITLPDTQFTVPEDNDMPIHTDEAQLETSLHEFDLGLVDTYTNNGAQFFTAPPTKRTRREPRRDTTRHTLPDADFDDSFASVGVARRAPQNEGSLVSEAEAAASRHVHELVGDLDLSASDMPLDPLSHISPVPLTNETFDDGGVGINPISAADISTDSIGFDVSELPVEPPAAATPPPARQRWDHLPSAPALPTPPLLPHPRASSTTPARHLTLDDVAHAHLTPHTAAKLRTAAEHRALGAPSTKAPRKRPIQDDVTELFPARARSLQARAASVAKTMNKQPHEQHCLPDSRIQLAILASHARGAKPALPRSLGMSWGAVLQGPLIDTIMPLTWDTRRAWLATQTAERENDMQHWLRAIHEQACELSADDEFPMEVGRRAPELPAWLAHEAEPHHQPDFMDIDSSMDLGTGRQDMSKRNGMDGFDISDVTDAPLDTEMPPAPDLPDLPPIDEPQEPINLSSPTSMRQADDHYMSSPVPLRRSSRHQHREAVNSDEANIRLPPLSRMSTPDLDDTDEVEVNVPTTNPIAAFDMRVRETSVDGYNIRTKRAAHVLRTTMDGDSHVSFDALASKGSRRAAAGFFFEMLVLGTHNCVRLEQDTPYGNMDIHAKEALWGM